MSRWIEQDTTSPGRARWGVVVSPAFLVLLGLLLGNDLYLKAHHPSWLTGKLSDFAGLALVALLVFSVLEVRHRLAAGLIALTFVWWKSPLSEPFINFVNELGAFPIGRVVDYTDLLALAVLPVAARVARGQTRVVRYPSLLVWPVLAVTFFAITGTSKVSPLREVEARSRSAAVVASADAIDSALRPVLQRHGCEITTARHCDGKHYSVAYTVDGTRVLLRVERKTRRAREVQNLLIELKAVLLELGFE